MFQFYRVDGPRSGGKQAKIIIMVWQQFSHYATAAATATTAATVACLNMQRC